MGLCSHLKKFGQGRSKGSGYSGDFLEVGGLITRHVLRLHVLINLRIGEQQGLPSSCFFFNFPWVWKTEVASSPPPQSLCLFSSAPDPAEALPLPPKTIIPASSLAPWPCLTLEESLSLFPTTKSYSILSLRVTFNPFKVFGGSSRSGPYILFHAYLCHSASFLTLHTELLWFPKKWGEKAFQVDVHVTCERLEMLKHMWVYRNPPFPGRSRWWVSEDLNPGCQDDCILPFTPLSRCHPVPICLLGKLCFPFLPTTSSTPRYLPPAQNSFA